MYYNVLRTDNYEHEKKNKKGRERKLNIYITHTPVHVSCIYKKLMTCNEGRNAAKQSYANLIYICSK